MSQHLKTCLCLLTSSCFLILSGCGVLFPDPDHAPIVLTKVSSVATPVLLDPTCPPPPQAPPKPPSGNTLSKDAAEYFAELDGWAMACRDLNEAIDAILRPSIPPPSPAP